MERLYRHTEEVYMIFLLSSLDRVVMASLVVPSSYVGHDSRFIVTLVSGKIVADILHRWLAPEEFRNIASMDADFSAQLSPIAQTYLSHGT